jgi:ABC-type polysaccharide/polyol phosphate export permease
VARLAEYVEARELVRSLVIRDVRGQYKGSVLGWFWSLLNPLTTVVIFTLFGAVTKLAESIPPAANGRRVFVLHLITGLIPWNAFAAALTGAAGAVVAQSALVTKVYFPRGVVVLAKLGALAFTAAIEMTVLVIALLVAGLMVLPWLPVVLLLFVLQSMLALGFGLVFAVANVYFRDVQYFLTLALQAMFYATPIVYPIAFVTDRGGRLETLYRLNPLVELVEAYRDVLYYLQWPSPARLAYLAVWAVVALALGWATFTRFEGRLAEEL